MPFNVPVVHTTAEVATANPQDFDFAQLPLRNDERRLTWDDKETFKQRLSEKTKAYKAGGDSLAPLVVYVAESVEFKLPFLASTVTTQSIDRCAEACELLWSKRRAYAAWKAKLLGDGVLAKARAALSACRTLNGVRDAFNEEAQRVKSPTEVRGELAGFVQLGADSALRRAHRHLFATFDELMDLVSVAHAEGGRHVVAMWSSIRSLDCALRGSSRAAQAVAEHDPSRLFEFASVLQSYPERILQVGRDTFGTETVDRFVGVCASAGFQNRMVDWVTAMFDAFGRMLDEASAAARSAFVRELAELLEREASPQKEGEPTNKYDKWRLVDRAVSEGESRSSYYAAACKPASLAPVPIGWLVGVDFMLLAFLAYSPEIGHLRPTAQAAQASFRAKVLDEAGSLFWRSGWFHNRASDCAGAVSIVLANQEEAAGGGGGGGGGVDEFVVRRRMASRLANAATASFFGKYFAPSFDQAKSTSAWEEFHASLTKAAARFEAERGNPVLDAMAVLERLGPEDKPIDHERVRELLRHHKFRNGGHSTEVEDTVSRVAKKVLPLPFADLVVSLGKQGFGHVGGMADDFPEQGRVPKSAWLVDGSSKKLPLARARLAMVAGEAPTAPTATATPTGKAPVTPARPTTPTTPMTAGMGGMALTATTPSPNRMSPTRARLSASQAMVAVGRSCSPLRNADAARYGRAALKRSDSGKRSAKEVSATRFDGDDPFDPNDAEERDEPSVIDTLLAEGEPSPTRMKTSAFP